MIPPKKEENSKAAVAELSTAAKDKKNKEPSVVTKSNSTAAMDVDADYKASVANSA